MIKRLLIALYILLVFTAAPAFAAPIPVVIAGIGGVLKAGGIGAMLFKTAFSLAIKAGLSLYAQAKQRREARKARAAGNGVTLQVQMGDTVARAYLIGDRATAGTRYYIGYWGEADGTPNAYLTDCVVLSCLPSRQGPQGLKAVYVGKRTCTPLWDEPHPDGRGYPLAELRVDGTDYGWIKYHDGTQTEADAFLRDKFAGHPDRPYLTSMIGRGCQIAILTIRQNADLYNNQLQSLLVWPKPMKLYDLTKDSTAGGYGPQRWDDPSTWGGDGDTLLPVLAYNVARGLYYRGRWVHGGRNFSAYRLPASSWIAAINEAARPGADGAPQYRGGLEVSVASEPVDVIEELRAGCSGRFAEVGGQIKLLVGAPGAAVYTFTDEDIVVTDEQKFKPFGGLKETYNTVTASYPEPAQLWTPKDAPEYAPDALLARDDGQRLPMELELDAVPHAAQVDLVKKTALEEAQRWRTHEAYFGPGARALEPNDPIAWTSADNNYANKAFVVVRATPVAGLRTLLVYKELDPADYNPPAISIAPIPGPTGAPPVPVQVMPGWQVFPDAIRDEAGVPRQPAIKVRCGGGLDGVTHVSVDVRIRETGQTVFSGFPLPYRAPYEWSIGPLPAETWVEAQGTLISTINSNQQASAWIAVRTPAVASSVIVDLAHIDADVRARMRELDAMAAALRAELERIDVDLSLIAANGELIRERIVQEVGRTRGELKRESLVLATQSGALVKSQEQLLAEFGGLSASVTGSLTALSEADQAMAQSILQLFVAAAGNTAAIQEERTARVTAEGALAQSIYSVNADFDGRFAQGLIQFRAEAAPSGVDARFALVVRGGAGEAYKVAGMYIDLVTVNGVLRSEIALVADRIALVSLDGQHRTSAAAFDNGVFKLGDLRVDFAQIDNVQIDWADIGDAVINNLVVGTSNLDFGAITTFAQGAGARPYAGGGAGDYYFLTLAVNNPNPHPALISLNGLVAGDATTNNGYEYYRYRVINETAGTILYQYDLTTGPTAAASYSIKEFFFDAAPVQGVNTYKVFVSVDTGYRGWWLAEAKMQILLWKR